MIIMVNGAFGVGKTSVTERLHQKLPNSMIYDPEYVGFILRHYTQGLLPPEEDTGDFQDIALWVPLVIDVAASLHGHY